MARNLCGPVMAACGHAALRGSAGVRWESGACSGGHKGRPYAVFSARFVGRGAHTPPDRARNHRDLLPFSVVEPHRREMLFGQGPLQKQKIANCKKTDWAAPKGLPSLSFCVKVNL